MLTDKEKLFIKNIAEKRFSSKRNAGISDQRSDGSICSEQNDVDSAGAEYFAAKFYNQVFDDSISVNGDPGHDFKIDGKTVEVIWLGRDKVSNIPRESGNLIVNPHEPKRWADIYVVVGGGFDEGYNIIGWTDHQSLICMQRVDFGFGKRYAMNIKDLNKGIIV
jgi:hypothetical protein